MRRVRGPQGTITSRVMRCSRLSTRVSALRTAQDDPNSIDAAPGPHCTPCSGRPGMTHTVFRYVYQQSYEPVALIAATSSTQGNARRPERRRCGLRHRIAHPARTVCAQRTLSAVRSVSATKKQPRESKAPLRTRTMLDIPNGADIASDTTFPATLDPHTSSAYRLRGHLPIPPGPCCSYCGAISHPGQRGTTRSAPTSLPTPTCIVRPARLAHAHYLLDTASYYISVCSLKIKYKHYKTTLRTFTFCLF
jgi:hypothetical protein